MKHNNGQSAIDLIFLALGVLAVAFFLSSAIAQSAVGAQALRAQSQTHNQGLLAILNQYAELQSNQNTPLKGRVLDLIAFEACSGCVGDSCSKIEERINRSAGLLNSKRRHYILDVEGVLRVYDNLSSVCLEGISVAQFNHTTSCGKKLNITYGAWSYAQKVKEPPC